MVTIEVAVPAYGASMSSRPGHWCALNVSKRKSKGPSTLRKSSVTSSLAVNSPRSLCTRTPDRRIAAKCSPRATATTETPARASAAARKPPIAPAPTTAMRVIGRNLEATGRFELPNGAFAEPCLTTWLRRPTALCASGTPLFSTRSGTSCLRAPTRQSRAVPKRVVGIEPTHQPWEGRRLPLHHTRPERPFRFEHPHTPSYNPE